MSKVSIVKSSFKMLDYVSLFTVTLHMSIEAIFSFSPTLATGRPSFMELAACLSANRGARMNECEMEVELLRGKGEGGTH